MGVVSRLYEVQEDRSSGTRKGREGKEKKKEKESKGRNSKEVFPRNFHIGNSYFNGG